MGRHLLGALLTVTALVTRASVSFAQPPVVPGPASPAAPAAAIPAAAPLPSAPVPADAPVPPPPPVAAAAPATGCVRDVDCKGERICVAGQCVAPAPNTTNAVLVPPGAQGSASPQMVVLYTPPDAESVSSTGVTVGLRVGVALPGGKGRSAGSDPVTGMSWTGSESDAVGVLLPVATLDLGYRFSPHLYLGAYFSGAYGTGSNCEEGGTSGASCYETQFRFGVDGEYKFRPASVTQPWVGLGIGWEIMNEMSTDDTGAEVSGSSSGVEFANLELGVDFRVADRAQIGPYGMVAFATYDNGAVHEFFTLGARVRYDTNWLLRR